MSYTELLGTLYLMRLVRQVLDDEHYTASRVAEITNMRVRRVRELLKFAHEMGAKPCRAGRSMDSSPDMTGGSGGAATAVATPSGKTDDPPPEPADSTEGGEEA